MEKEIAFLIWLYDRQLSHDANDPYDQSYLECSVIREKYADFFGINEQSLDLFKNPRDEKTIKP